MTNIDTTSDNSKMEKPTEDAENTKRVKNTQNTETMFKKLFLTIYFWTFSIFGLLISFPICCILYPFVSKKVISRLYQGIPEFLALNAMLVPKFWTLNIKDMRKSKTWKRDDQFVVVGNHLSFIDSLILATLPLDKKFMIGRIFTKIPIFGWLAKMSGYIPVDRNEPNNMKSLENSGVHRALQQMEDGSSFCIFPSGRRVQNPRDFSDFKSGAFYIAFLKEVSILPVILRGTEKCLPIGGLVNTGDIEMIIEEPFSIEKSEEIPEKIEYTKQLMLKYL